MADPTSLGVIDEFVATFTSYIDSGFGLLGGEVQYLTAILIGIDITLAGLYWAMGSDSSVIGKFLKKVMYVGVFALIITNFSSLANIIFDSFGGLGLKATATTMTADDLLRPGFIANTGFTAAHPILEQIGELTGPVKFFHNIVLIVALFLAWIITMFAFFFIAIQLFVTILEFKLTTLAGFILIPFALWNKTSFLAEKVLGNVVASGIKHWIDNIWRHYISVPAARKLARPHCANYAQRCRFNHVGVNGAPRFRYLWAGHRIGACFGRAATRCWSRCRHYGSCWRRGLSRRRGCWCWD